MGLITDLRPVLKLYCFFGFFLSISMMEVISVFSLGFALFLMRCCEGSSDYAPAYDANKLAESNSICAEPRVLKNVHAFFDMTLGLHVSSTEELESATIELRKLKVQLSDLESGKAERAEKAKKAKDELKALKKELKALEKKYANKRKIREDKEKLLQQLDDKAAELEEENEEKRKIFFFGKMAKMAKREKRSFF